MKLNLGMSIVILGSLLSSSVFATNGYFRHGYGHNSAAMAGATTAAAQDAIAGAYNPGSIWQIEDQMSIDLSLFLPDRKFTVSGTEPQDIPAQQMPLQLGSTTSGKTGFAIPNIGYKTTLNDRWAMNIAAFAQGGMNTSYAKSVFAAGNTGVDLSQLFLSASFAYKVDQRTQIGFAPIAVYQRFSAEGLTSFASFSANPDAVSNRGYDNSYGYGYRIGIAHRVSEQMTLGASYQDILEVTKFDKYSGLFAEQGRFDVPTTWNVGVAWQQGDLLLTLDHQTIKYADVNAIGHGFMPAFAQIMMGSTDHLLGAKYGPGFGWRDMRVAKAGLAYRLAKGTFRAGISYGKQPIEQTEVLFNILAPGVQEWHFTAGYEYQLNNGDALSLSVMHSPKKQISGLHPANQQQQISLSMEQFEVTLGYRF
ncbi:outer membrane protein transport protein [Thalassotalea ponticola]|uniref:OmpP1/FadL family transporter n=1 Tax=Thalassotalea ponticola TaxID=1523392 RepID=UPI0025B50EA6|nr:outer membrane protein transport protein [Thalassotalea ponticola]MDN3652604.1 outer membrane protein transport protein [Thalassotalea ponticola]